MQNSVKNIMTSRAIFKKEKSFFIDQEHKYFDRQERESTSQDIKIKVYSFCGSTLKTDLEFEEALSMAREVFLSEAENKGKFLAFSLENLRSQLIMKPYIIVVGGHGGVINLSSERELPIYDIKRPKNHLNQYFSYHYIEHPIHCEKDHWFEKEDLSIWLKTGHTQCPSGEHELESIKIEDYEYCETIKSYDEVFSDFKNFRNYMKYVENLEFKCEIKYFLLASTQKRFGRESQEYEECKQQFDLASAKFYQEKQAVEKLHQDLIEKYRERGVLEHEISDFQKREIARLDESIRRLDESIRRSDEIIQKLKKEKAEMQKEFDENPDFYKKNPPREEDYWFIILFMSYCDYLEKKLNVFLEWLENLIKKLFRKN